MASFFEKIGLVERREEVAFDDSVIGDIEAQLLASKQAVTEPEANLSEVKVDTLIDDIYNENDLADKSRSIFKVRELSNTLPKEMSNATKKATVLGILNVSGLPVDEVVADGVERMEILNSVKSQIVIDSDTKVNQANTEVEELKAKIEELQRAVALTEAEKEQSIKLITEEVDSIADLCKFIAEGEK